MFAIWSVILINYLIENEYIGTMFSELKIIDLIKKGN